MAGEDDDPTNWTEKGVRPSIRKVALDCARKRAESAAAWLSRAVETQANIERADGIIPPSSSGPTSADKRDAERAPMAVDPAALASLIHAAVEAAKAANMPLPKTTARQAARVTEDAIRAARGLPARVPRQPRRLAIEAE